MGVIQEILRLREPGHTTCAVVDLHAREAGPSAVDRVVQAHGFRGITTEWLEISAADAHAIVTTLLHRDLAYNEEIMSIESAFDLATRFFDLAPEPHSFFTNGEWSRAHIHTRGTAPCITGSNGEMCTDSERLKQPQRSCPHAPSNTSRSSRA